MNRIDLANDAIDLLLGYRDKYDYELLTFRDRWEEHMKPMKPVDIADDAIGLFLEYRDQHGYNEETARHKAVDEIREAKEFSDEPGEGTFEERDEKTEILRSIAASLEKIANPLLSTDLLRWHAASAVPTRAPEELPAKEQLDKLAEDLEASMGTAGEDEDKLKEAQSNLPAPLGRAQFHIERFADDLQRSFGGPPLAKARRERLNHHRVGRLYRDIGRGSFDVLLVDDDGASTGYIARVAISYSRFEASN